MMSLLASRSGSAVLACALSACSYSSLDDDVLPEVTEAAVTLDTSMPAAQAIVRVTLLLKPGPRADRVVELTKVVFRAPTMELNPQELATLGVFFPASFDGCVNGGENKSVVLENAATTNQTLQPLCGQTVNLVVTLGYPDEPGTGTLSPPFPLVVGCP